MATFEKAPSAASEEEPSNLGSWEPAVEKLDHNDVGTAREQRIESRAVAVDRLMNEPLPKELIDQVDERAVERANAARMSKPDDSFMDTYVRSKVSGNQFGRLMSDLREGKTLKDEIAEMEQEATDSIDRGEEHTEKLDGMKAFSQLLRESALGDNESWEDLSKGTGQKAETARQQIRLSERLEAEVITQGLRYQGKVKHLNEEKPGYILRKVSYLERLKETADTSGQTRTRLNSAVNKVRSTYADVIPGREEMARAEKSVESAGEDSEEIPSDTSATESFAYTASPAEATSTEEVYADTSSLDAAVEKPAPEPQPKLKSQEAVFGREGVSPEDLKGISGQINELLKTDTRESVVAAARQLAHLKRARVKIADGREKAVFDKLNKHREGMGEVDAAEQARYLSHLKYLGALKGGNDVTGEERVRIEKGITDRMKNERLGDLDSLSVNANYIGVRRNFEDMRALLKRDMDEKLSKPDNDASVTFARARRKAIDVDYSLPDEHLGIEDRVDSRLAEYRERGQWGRYARLRAAVDYVRGDAPVDEAVQKGMERGVKVARRRAQERGDWRSYTEYVADAATLSRRTEGVTEEPKVRRRADSEVLQQLGELERKLRREAREQARQTEVRVRERAQEQVQQTEKKAVDQEEPILAEVVDEGEEQAEDSESGWRRWWRRVLGRRPKDEARMVKKRSSPPDQERRKAA